MPIDPNPGVKDSWRWNGSYTNPSLEPSVHVHLPEDKSCHVFLRKAAIEFCGDTTPSDLTGEVFANRTVPLGPLPAWYKPDYEDVNDAV